MKRFNQESQYGRIIQDLEENSTNFKNISMSPHGPVSELIRAFVESNAEFARYLEYLLAEKKWDLLRNFTSLIHQATALNKKAKRKVSARGYALVTHTDQAGVNRLSNLGDLFTDPETASDFDDIQQATASTALQKSALIPWTVSSLYEIPKGTKFSSKSGLHFISTESKSIKQFNYGISRIKSNPELYNQFLEEGSWNGYKYILVPIVEGTVREVNLGVSNGLGSQTILLNTLNIEAADCAQTRDFLYATVEDDFDESQPDGLTHWTEVDRITGAPSSAKVFELRITNDHSGTMVIFGDGLNGAIPPENKAITFHYLETSGGAGNLTKKYSLNDEIELDAPILDPRDNTNTGFLHCTNHLPVLGGRDLETKAQFKDDAEKTYRKKVDTIFELEDLKENIYKYTPMPLYLVNAKRSNGVSYKTINGYKYAYHPIIISALDTDGENLDSTNAAILLSQLKQYINEQKLVYDLDLEYQNYKQLLIDVNTSIEIDTSKNLISSEADFVKDVEDMIVLNNGLSAVEPGNNKLTSSNIDKPILDKYHKSILDIQTDLWLRSFQTELSFYYGGNQILETDVASTITKANLIDSIDEANAQNTNTLVVIAKMKADHAISNAVVSSSKIRSGILGNNIPILINLAPDATDTTSIGRTLALIDNGASSGLLNELLAANTTGVEAFDGFTDKWYHIDYAPDNDTNKNQRILLGQLKNAGTQSLSRAQSIIENQDISTIDGLLEMSSDQGYIADQVYVTIPNESEIDIAIPINKNTFAFAAAQIASLAESLRTNASSIQLSAVYQTLANCFSGYNIYTNTALIDRSAISRDINALMFVSTAKVNISKEN